MSMGGSRVRSARPLEPDALLRHAGFLHHLASRLVRDPGTADDVVQETMLRALDRPPEPRQGIRAWLAAVARNAARMTRRAEARRAARERAAARPESVVTPEGVREREAARREVVAAVLRLGEPHRDVVLLRFYEGLPPREAAARLGLPVETVRTRTRRAIERLRDDLDRRHRGDRSAWVAILSPLAHLVVPAAGGALVSAQTKTLALAAVLLLALAGTLAIVASDGVERGGEPAREGALPAAPGAAPEAAPRLEGGGAAAEPLAPAAATAAAGPRANRPAGVLRGFALSGRTHEPVAGARVVARATAGAVLEGRSTGERASIEASTRSDAEGRFAIEGLPFGAYDVTATDEREGTAEDVGVSASSPAWLRLYLMPSRPEETRVEARVLNERRQPVAGARVEWATGDGRPLVATTTDAGGRARFDDVDVVARNVVGWLTATAPEGTARVVVGRDLRLGRPAGRPLELVLEPAGAIEGRLLGPPGAAVGGTAVEAWALQGGFGTWTVGVRRVATADADGAYRIAGLPAGEYTMVVASRAGLRLDLGRREGTWAPAGSVEYAPLVAKVAAGATARLDLRIVAGGAVRGRVVRADGGAPVAGARVEVHLPQGQADYEERVTRGGVPLWRLDGAWPDAWRHPLNFRVLATDAEGRYEASGLLPGPYRVVVVPRGLALDRKEPVEVEDGRAVELVHRVVPAGTLEAVVPPTQSLGIRRRGEEAFVAMLIAPAGASGALTVPGLAPGPYELRAVHSRPDVPSFVLAEFEIVAGRTTYLDALATGNVDVRVRLLDGAVPVVGAMIDLFWHGRTTLVTDEEGRVADRFATFPGGDERISIGVELPGPGDVALGTHVRVGAPETELHLPTGSLRVEAVDRAGRRAAGARVAVEARVAEGATWWLAGSGPIAVTGADGAATFAHLPAGAYPVSVRFRDRGTLARGVATVGAGPVELSLREPPAGSIRVRVEDVDGRAAPDVPLALTVLPASEDPGPAAADRWERAAPWVEVNVRTDAAGGWVYRGVPEGLARVHAWVMDDAGWTAVKRARADVEVRADGESEVVLRLR
jgi:RNA polymerase sigma-70 factor (ECF subfamily)